MSTGDERGKSALERIVNNRIVAYKQQMPMVRQTETFSAWLKDLRDARGRVKILARVQRLEDGNAGDVAPVGDGVSEMRIHFGPGYRVYYVNRGGELILLLCGGDKGSQQRDIEAAKKLAREED
jgi:putative addiction module killer protein